MNNLSLAAPCKKYVSCVDIQTDEVHSRNTDTHVDIQIHKSTIAAAQLKTKNKNQVSPPPLVPQHSIATVNEQRLSTHLGGLRQSTIVCGEVRALWCTARLPA